MEIVENQTRKRLEQTKKIFEQVKSQFANDDLDNFEISLNNFVTNSRTITFLMQKEFSNIQKFKDWYNSKINEMKNKGFDKFKDIRNILQKQGDIRNTIVLHVNVTPKGEKGSRLLTAEIDEKGKKKNKIYGKVELKPFFGPAYNLDFKNLDKTAIKECEEYLNYLDLLVKEVYSKFKTEVENSK